MANRSRKKDASKQIRYVVVGLGHIAQVAVLPAFQHARSNSQLTAFISGDEKKLRVLGARYNVPDLYSYEQFDDCLHSGLVDAVYIALPNDTHRDYAMRAAKTGVHVLSEKPLGRKLHDCGVASTDYSFNSWEPL